MIPAGRTAIDTGGIGEIYGLTRKQVQNRRLWELPGAPKPFKEGARRPLYDRAQWEAFAAGRELPVWRVGTRTDPLDLLDQDEAAEVLDVGTSTVRAYATEGRLTRVDVCGVTHFRRRELVHRKENPGEPGRPPRPREK
ncbi:helix-turn-helix domain-containing protein [Herbidospora mongoliensis]|uniref:helix-turn-helix domain-containing protein n=1 Tax=Herbidospora mongoliensis TaxID=688067 RepID=UPI00082B39C6|nr:helix-turn-helix domain-containing protein [Herbidospora mongoliensis]